MVYPTDMGIKWDQSIHSMDLGFPDGQECPFSCLWTAMASQKGVVPYIYIFLRDGNRGQG